MIGYRYIRTPQNDWRLHHGALIPLNMPHSISVPSFLETLKLLVRYRALFIRWEDNFDELSDGEWWHIIKTEVENLDVLSKKTRYGVRCGQNRFVATHSTREEICDEGFDVYIAAFDRYETFEAVLSPAKFHEAINAMPAETEFWAVRDKKNNQMVAFSENIVRDDACFYNSIWFESNALKSYAGYLLFFEMNKYYLNDRGFRYVSDGARSISHQTNIHEFLQRKFGYRKVYSSLRMRYFPGVKIAIYIFYPFRRWFENRSFGFFQKIAVLLKQESIRRSCLARGK